MQRRWLVTVGCAALLVLLAGGFVGAVGAGALQDDDEFPRAEAGLDQTVEQNASVLLDGSQSFSPEGEISNYEWAIETPNGSTKSPSCDTADCRQARFRVPRLGQYNVTLTVTDDDGREMSDTLYVTVVPRGDFGVTLTGPGSTGSEANLTATVAPGDVAAQNISWFRDGEPLGNRSLPATGGTFNKSTLIAPGSTYRAVVNGSWNHTASDTWTAPGGTSTPGSANPGEYPRIEGPAVVTGDPDRRGNTWRFDSTDYVLRTNDRGSVRESTWEMPHSSIASRWSRENSSLVRPPLEPGENLIRTDVTVQRGDAIRPSDEERDSKDPKVTDINISESISRTIIVDPAPQIDRLNVEKVGDLLLVSYSGEDRYNSPEEVEIVVGATTVYSAGGASRSFRNDISVEIPADAYGETNVRLRVVDGRGQVATAVSSVSLPDQTQSTYETPRPDAMRIVYNEEEEQIESAGGEVLLKETN